MTLRFDIAVVGSGFAGSLMAMIARRLGYSVALLERGTHPRVVIGESSTPLSNLLLETIAERYGLSALLPLTKWGTWQEVYPHLACGLKRGFTFFHHHLDEAAPRPRDVADQLLVAASPNDRIADTHWFRADLDTFFVEQARELGALYLDELQIEGVARHSGNWQLAAHRRGKPYQVEASFLIDATGPRGFLHRTLHLGEASFPDFPETSSVYSHFRDVAEFAPLSGLPPRHPPYPPDAAALHHVFDGGWMWVLRFDNGWTSAGFSLQPELAASLDFADNQAAWQSLLDRLPSVKQQFARATPLRPLTYAARTPFRSAKIAGEGWAMLPSAAGFVDPLLSTGFALTLLGVSRMAQSLERNPGFPPSVSALDHYATQTQGDLLATADLIGALFGNLGHFPTFRALSLLYFAAASYAETVRRLGKPERASTFLLHGDPIFGPEARRLNALARGPLSSQARQTLEADIYRLVAGFDVAGLSKRPPDHCYPVRADDLFTAAERLGATREEIETLLHRAGFVSDPEPPASLAAQPHAAANP